MKWTEEQIEIVRQQAGKITSGEIGAMIGRHAQSVRDKMCQLGIRCNPSVSYCQWTPQQVEILKANAGKLSSVEIGKIVGMSNSAVSSKIRALGLPKIAKCNPNVWTVEQLAKLKLLETGLATLPQLSREFGFGMTSISLKARQLGYKIQRGDGWRAHEDELIRELAGKMCAKEIGRKIGRSKCSVHSRANRLGINLRTDGQPTKKVPRVRGPRQKSYRAPKPKPIKVVESAIHICPKHHCPVSNWEEHRKRMGCDAPPPHLVEYYAKACA
jgi:hypothetical protein